MTKETDRVLAMDDETLLQHLAGLEVSSTELVRELREERQWRKFAKTALAIAFTAIIVLGYFCFIVLSAIREGQQEDRVSGRAFRRALADCTVRPGAILDDGFINPGVCFTESQTRSRGAIDTAVSNITDEVRKLLIAQAEATAANRSLASEVRSAAAAQARALKNMPTTTIPRPPIVPPITTTTVVPAPPPTPPPERGLVCDILSIVGLCGGG